MWNKKHSEENFSEVQKLLALKRLDMPSQRYFDGVLNEFHQRQRAALLQPRYSFVSRAFSLVEALRDGFRSRQGLRYAFAGVAVAALLAAGLNQSWKDGATPTLVLQAPASANATADHFAFSQALEPQKVSSVDQQIDAASVEPVSLDNKVVLPHYVIAQAPASYDTTMAF